MPLQISIVLATAALGGTGEASETPTYSRDVAAIVQKRCQGCHRPGQVGPFALQSYEDVRGRAKMIAAVLEAGSMPPWNADERYDGVFVNERRLPDEERQVLLSWIAAGTPRGKASEDPAAIAWPAGWSIGEPDVVLTPDYDRLAQAPLPPEGFEVPREGVVQYRYFSLKTDFPEDRWARAFEIRPGAPDVTHHVLATLQGPGGSIDEKGFLATYVPGDTPSIYPDGYAKRIPKGASILFQVHYTPNGKARRDRPALAVVFADGPPELVVESAAILNQSFEVPAGAANHEVRASRVFDDERGLLSLMPHMHTRGKDFRVVAHYPDGVEEELLLAHYDFAWQEVYILPDPLPLPPGTRLECIGHFDNSNGNPNNPDPNLPVRWGEQTFEEMFVGYLDTVVPLE